MKLCRNAMREGRFGMKPGRKWVEGSPNQPAGRGMYLHVVLVMPGCQICAHGSRFATSQLSSLKFSRGVGAFHQILSLH